MWSLNPIENPHFKSQRTAQAGLGCVNLVSDVPHSSRCPLSICVAENDVTVVVFNVFLRKINFGFVVVACRTILQMKEIQILKQSKTSYLRNNLLYMQYFF